MIASKGKSVMKNIMKNVSIVTSNTRLGRWIPGVWVSSIRFIVSVVAIVFGLSAPITATAAEVLTSGTYLQMEGTGKLDLRHTVLRLTKEGKKSKDWTGGEAPRWKQVAQADGRNWTSKWSMMEADLNKWSANVLTNGLTEKEWVAQAAAIKAKYGEDGLEEFIALFASKETTGNVGKFTKALWQKGNTKNPGTPLDLAELVNR
jgi:hypothetical protein